MKRVGKMLDVALGLCFAYYIVDTATNRWFTDRIKEIVYECKQEYQKEQEYRRLKNHVVFDAMMIVDTA